MLRAPAMSDTGERSERRIVIELVSSADVKRLEERDEAVREEIRQLEKRFEGLHKTVYELLEVLNGLQRKR